MPTQTERAAPMPVAASAPYLVGGYPHPQTGYPAGGYAPHARPGQAPPGHAPPGHAQPPAGYAPHGYAYPQHQPPAYYGPQPTPAPAPQWGAPAHPHAPYPVMSGQGMHTPVPPAGHSAPMGHWQPQPQWTPAPQAPYPPGHYAPQPHYPHQAHPQAHYTPQPAPTPYQMPPQQPGLVHSGSHSLTPSPHTSFTGQPAPAPQPAYYPPHQQHPPPPQQQQHQGYPPAAPNGHPQQHPGYAPPQHNHSGSYALPPGAHPGHQPAHPAPHHPGYVPAPQYAHARPAAAVLPGQGPIAERAFDAADRERKGALDLTNFETAISLLGVRSLPYSQIVSVFCLSDIDKDGQISRSEFIRVAPELLAGAAFARAKPGPDGSLDMQGLSNALRLLGFTLAYAEVAGYYARGDADGDFRISFGEFWHMVPRVMEDRRASFDDMLARFREAVAVDEAAAPGRGTVRVSPEQAVMAFIKADERSVGQLGLKEFANALNELGIASGGEMSMLRCFQEADRDGNRVISRAEFLAIFTQPG